MVRKVIIILILFAAISLLYWSRCEAQFFANPRPVITEKCDTLLYVEIKNGVSHTIAIYLFEDGSAWVQDKNYLEYMDKRKFSMWKRKNIKL